MGFFSFIFPWGLVLQAMALVHFVWQGALVAAALAAGLAAVRRDGAALRHMLACMALALMLALPVLTTAWLMAVSGRPMPQSSPPSGA